ncbi:hypothetical protein [Sphingomonas immobilis]|uniref:Uncharacterized protein n=1 Tax=Sphingomonas immobilis TaxID=3063997 RepID=A0ABT9A4R1_9SPHN|nr:hypothetical protein [Sphingomonas sp. CA1-15]MDO7843712.1 hypothetical protein [Sphingomonas sp. CA1-15]
MSDWTELAGASAEPLPRPRPPHTAVRWWMRASATFGIISAFNMIAHAQSLVQISQSLHKLHLWWQGCLHVLFSALHIHVAPPVQNAIVLLGLAISTANLAMYARFDITIFGIIRSILFSYPETAERLARKKRHEAVMAHLQKTEIRYFGATAIVMIALIGIIAVYYPVFGAYLLIAIGLMVLFVVAIVRKWTDVLSDKAQAAIMLPLYFICMPAMVLFMVAITVAIFHRQIAWTAGIVLLLLLANFAFVHIVDPLAPLLNNLPDPPKSWAGAA